MIIYRKLKLIGAKKPIDVYRCMTCETLVVDESQESLKLHGGHKLKSPCKVSLLEYLALVLRIIR